jgi:hypothetical protein
LALGIVCAGALGWIALSAYGSKVEKKLQTEQLKKLNEHLARGIPIKDPLKIELNAWREMRGGDCFRRAGSDGEE